MRVVVVGGDRLGQIPARLADCGFKEVVHVTGRKVRDISRQIPMETCLIVVLTDYVNHALAEKVREEAKKRCIPVVFARRAWSAIHFQLRRLGLEEVRTCVAVQ
ncbi:Uncharacterized conserved protein UCP020408 [Ammonifex degensii KC4]|uniref:Uncharacterized conserved protein UCP020408 n=1 Tax=Ammonifex degensii (strain DSM 10501 / KC4) TaxID=429009 RepID=C9RC07_AMMDK|nr:DUF2325 domain-containing protein [Ammonifex degensii]ACX51784.1 Uncharacterized conserved protein UCP020408 [Ammonifex degensii KC4]